jgi:hypothetical protein
MMDGHSFGVIYGIFSSAPWTGSVRVGPRRLCGYELRDVRTQLGSSADAIQDNLYWDEVVAFEIFLFLWVRLI